MSADAAGIYHIRVQASAIARLLLTIITVYGIINRIDRTGGATGELDGAAA